MYALRAALSMVDFIPFDINRRNTIDNPILKAHPARVTALAQCLRLAGEQHAVRRHLGEHGVLMQMQRRQVIGRVVEAKVGRLANERAPLAHPTPEDVACVALQSPDAGISTVVREELGEHFLSLADTQELGVRRKLCPVVWGRRGCGAQLERRVGERLQQHSQRLGIVMLDARRLIEHDAAKDRRIKPMQPVVVGDVDAGPNVANLAAMLNLYANCGAFSDCLCGHSERRQDQHRPRGVLMNDVRPLDLHPSLAEPCVSEDCRASTSQSPFGKRALMREQRSREFAVTGNSCWHRDAEFVANEVVVVHAFTGPRPSSSLAAG
jgi:hypothetical protein